MTGSRFARKFLAPLTVAAVAVSPVATAEAHELKNTQKQRRHIEQRVRSQVGKRYSYGSESPRRGFDCSGLTYWVFRKHGITLPRTSADQFKLGRKKGHVRIWKRNKLKTGDLVFHKTTSARVGHVGIYVGKGRFISAISRGVRVQSLYDRYYWGKRWVGAVRLKVTRDL